MPEVSKDARVDHPTILISSAGADQRLAYEFGSLLNALPLDVRVVFTAEKEGTGITIGNDWLSWLRDNVQSASYVVVVLTRGALSRPWMAWEAGVIAAASEGARRILPITFRVEPSEVMGPFAQFQLTRGDSYEDMVRLLTSLIRELEGNRSFGAMAHLPELVRPYVERINQVLDERGQTKQEEAEPQREGFSTAPAQVDTQTQPSLPLDAQDGRMLCELLFRLVVKLRERPEILQSLDATAFWAAVRKIRPSASTLEDLRSVNADLSSEPGPGALWSSWVRNARATELAAFVRHPDMTRITA